MDKKKGFMIILAAFVLLIAGASMLYNRLGEELAPEQLAVAETTAPEETDGTERPSIPAPDFTVYDADGNAVKLSEFFGKPIVLNFWASWCGPCKREMPDFNEKSQALEGSVQFLMVNMTDGARETVETATAFIEEQGYTLPVLFDITLEAAYTYGTYSLPTTFFIDADGNAVAQVNGAMSGETLQRGIDLIYKP